MTRELVRRPAPELELRSRKRRAMCRKSRQELHLDEQLRFDICSLRESEDPDAVYFERHAVAPLAEVFDMNWIELGELRADDAGDPIAVEIGIAHSMI